MLPLSSLRMSLLLRNRKCNLEGKGSRCPALSQQSEKATKAVPGVLHPPQVTASPALPHPGSSCQSGLPGPLRLPLAQHLRSDTMSWKMQNSSCRPCTSRLCWLSHGGLFGPYSPSGSLVLTSVLSLPCPPVFAAPLSVHALFYFISLFCFIYFILLTHKPIPHGTHTCTHGPDPHVRVLQLVNQYPLVIRQNPGFLPSSGGADAPIPPLRARL